MSVLSIALLAIIAFLAVCAFFAAGNSHASSSGEGMFLPPSPPPAPHPRSPSLFFETDWIGQRNHRHDAAIERHRAAARSSGDHEFPL